MSAGLPPPLQALLDGLSLHGAHELQRALAICLVAPYPPRSGDPHQETPGPDDTRRHGRLNWPAYTRDESTAAIRRCAAAIGRRPSSGVYFTWRAAEVRRAHERGAATPRLPSQPPVYRIFGSWPKALTAAMITDDDVLEHHPLPEYRAAGRIRATIAELSDREISAFGIDDVQIAILRTNGPSALTLPSASKLASGLGGSVDWLAERTPHPGVPANAERGRLDCAAVTRLANELGATEQDLRGRLKLGLGPYRRLAAGKLEPTLQQATELASALRCGIDGLLMPH